MCVRARACVYERVFERSCVCRCGCGCRSIRAGVCLPACGLINPACNATLYYHLRPLWIHHIFPHYLINGTIFGKKLLKGIFISRFSTTFISNISHYKKNVKTSPCKVPLLLFLIIIIIIIIIIQRDIVICVKTSPCKPVVLFGF